MEGIDVAIGAVLGAWISSLVAGRCDKQIKELELQAQKRANDTAIEYLDGMGEYQRTGKWGKASVSHTGGRCAAALDVGNQNGITRYPHPDAA